MTFYLYHARDIITRDMWAYHFDNFPRLNWDKKYWNEIGRYRLAWMQ